MIDNGIIEKIEKRIAINGKTYWYCVIGPHVFAVFEKRLINHVKEGMWLSLSILRMRKDIANCGK